MASPQPDQFTKISSELLEAFCLLQLSGSEWSFVHALMRKTYGYNKKEDWVTNSQIMKLTGLDKERVSEAKKKLLLKGVVTEKRNKIGLQKDYDLWKELRKNVNTIDNIDNTTKDISKLSLQKANFMENLIPEVIKLFESVDPKNKTFYGNKTQRCASQFLLDEYGFDEIKKRIEVLPKTNRMKYFPNITTPCQLRDKWVILDNQIQRHRSEQLSQTSKVAF